MKVKRVELQQSCHSNLVFLSVKFILDISVLQETARQKVRVRKSWLVEEIRRSCDRQLLDSLKLPPNNY